MPQWQLIGIQMYRVVGFIFVLLAIDNLLPAVFAIPAGLGDTLTGLFAIPAAYLERRHQLACYCYMEATPEQQ